MEPQDYTKLDWQLERCIDSCVLKWLLAATAALFQDTVHHSSTNQSREKRDMVHMYYILMLAPHDIEHYTNIQSRK